MAKAFILAVAFFLPQLVYSLSARLQRDNGNAAARNAITGDQLEAAGSSGSISYNLYARRDDFAGDRSLLNAAALVYSGFSVEDHRFAFGLGSHYRQEKMQRVRAGQGDFYPAVGFFWSHPQFRADLSGSEYLTRVSLSGMVDLGLPVELNSDFEYLHSQPYRWSANAFLFVSRFGGAIAGYEPLSQRVRAGLWLAPVKELRLSALTRFGSGETFWELALSFQLDSAVQAPGELPRYHANAGDSDEDDEPKKWQRRKPKNVPAFAVLVKWGLTPVEALKFTREKDACALSERSRRLLTAKNWGCRDA
ncbi:MAG: hypothetical protein OHK0011_03140 [Turneriella sp.]